MTAPRDASGAPLTCGAKEGQRPCSARTAGYLHVGCVHEHIYRTSLCARHLAVASKRRAACTPCRNGEQSHDCPLHVMAQKAEETP